MTTMSRKKSESAGGDPSPDPTPKKRYPSRDKVKYLGIPLSFYAALERYAEQHSTPFDKKSVQWAARVLFGPVLQELGLLDASEEEASD